MKAFLEEYGLIIVVVAVIMVMLLLGTTVGGDAKANIVATVKNFLTTAEQVYPDLENPGGAGSGSGGSGEVSGELNEYGFYFNKRYSYHENGKLVGYFMFNEDTSIETAARVFSAEAGGTEWNGNNFTASSGIFTWSGNISDDGLTGRIGDVDVTLTRYNGATQSSNKIYYGAEYTGTNSEGEFTFVAYSDGSAVALQSTPYPAGAATFSDGNLLMGGEVYGTFSSNGKTFTTVYDEVFVMED